jgi:hypothetical protein
LWDQEYFSSTKIPIRDRLNIAHNLKNKTNKSITYLITAIELIELIATHNCEDLYPKEDDTKEKAENRLEILQQSHAIIDFYTDKMVPAVAGVKLWGPSIRHLEPMSVSCLPKQPGKLHVTTSTEAFVLVLYKNGYKKWKAMIKWKKAKANKNKKYPKYNPKKPNLNKQFSTPYSSGNCGQQKFGGWSDEGKDFHMDLQRRIQASRKDNPAIHLKEDEACFAHLKLQYKDLYPDEEDGEPTKRGKKRKAMEVDEDAEEEENNGDLDEWLQLIED